MTTQGEDDRDDQILGQWEANGRNEYIQEPLADRRSLRTCIGVCISVIVLVCILASISSVKDLALRAKYLKPGIASYRQGDYTTAQKDLEAYIRLSGNENTNAEYVLGMCLYRNGNPGEAEQHFLLDRYFVGRRRYYNYGGPFQAPGTHIRHRSEIMIERITGRQILP